MAKLEQEDTFPKEKRTLIFNYKRTFSNFVKFRSVLPDEAAVSSEIY